MRESRSEVADATDDLNGKSPLPDAGELRLIRIIDDLDEQL